MRQLTINLYPKDRCMSKQWFIKYTNPVEGGADLKRFIPNKLKLEKERVEFSNAAIKEIEQEWELAHLSTEQRNIKGLLNDLYDVIEYRSMGRRHKTKTTYMAYFNVFKEWYMVAGSSCDLSKMGFKFLSWMHTTGRNNTTHNNYRRQMGSFFRDLCKIHPQKYTINPFESARKLPEARKTKKWFRPEMQQKLKAAISIADPELWLAAQIQYYCFIRPHEMNELKIENIRFETSEFVLHAQGTKNKKIEVVPIPEQLMKQLLPFKDFPEHYLLFSKSGGPGLAKIARDNLSRRHRTYTGRAGLGPGYSFYSWKNTGAVALVKNKVHIKVISMLMRHSSIEITDEYLKTLQIDDLLRQQMIVYTEL